MFWSFSLRKAGGDIQQYRDYHTLIDKYVSYFKSSDRMSGDWTNGVTSLSTDGAVAKEGSPKFYPRPGRGLNPGPHGWQSEILPTVLASHTHVSYGEYNDKMTMFFYVGLDFFWCL